MKTLQYWLILLILSVSTSCSGSTEDTPATVDSAETALADGDVDRAIALCNQLCSSADTTQLGWRDYCRLATIFAVAYDKNIDAEASISAATRCYGRAVALQPDSAAAFMPAPEYYSMFMTARHVFDGLSMDPADITDHEEDPALQDVNKTSQQ